MPTKGKKKTKIEENEAYLLDISKADQIFDFLVKDKQIKLPEGHKLPPTNQIQNMSYSYCTNNCTIFYNVIQKTFFFNYY